MSQRLAESRILRNQSQRFIIEREQLPNFPKSGNLIANNAGKNLTVARDSNGNKSIGIALSNSIATRKTRTSALDNGSVDYKSATF